MNATSLSGSHSAAMLASSQETLFFDSPSLSSARAAAKVIKMFGRRTELCATTYNE